MSIAGLTSRVYIASKIDRALVTDRWMSVFSKSHAYFHPSSTFDHSPYTVILDT